MEVCEPLVAQSLLFHALDYARSLGFGPHPDVPMPLLGPRPERLVDTPFARPERPMYASGPDDDVARVFATLDRVVGRGNYDILVDAGQVPFGAFDEAEEEEDEEEDSEG